MYEDEVWKDIHDYEGLYQISNYGRVKSLERKAYNPGMLGDDVYRKVPEMIRKHNIMKGYHCISLMNNKSKKVYRVARLVLESFGFPQPSVEYQVSYLDGNKDNLHISNLKWMTPSESMTYASSIGRIKPHTEERRKKTSEQFKKLWENEEYRKTISENSKSMWNDPDRREKALKSMRAAGEKRRIRNAEIKAAIPKPEPYHVPDLDGEIWEDIAGFEGLYMVSSCGRVKGCDRILPHKTHGTWHIKERIIKPSLAGPGKSKYKSVQLHVGKGKMCPMKVHRLVAEAFLPNPNRLPQVNHIDGNKLNNNVSNLEWVTEQGNVDHAWRTGLCENIVKAKQRPVINLDTGERFASVLEAERSFGKSTGAISHVLQGKHERAHGYRWAYAEE